MSFKDTLEVGLKPDAPYRKDLLPDFQKEDPACETAAEPGDGADKNAAREACDNNPGEPLENVESEKPSGKPE